MQRIRLDQLLVARGSVATRSRARDVIRRGLVRVDGFIATKAGMMVGEDAVVTLPEDAAAHVSRAADKLIAALDVFGFDPAGRICLDVGASTGGFSQVLVKRGAAKVYAVDVGHEQLHAALRNEPRIVSLEGVDARKLDHSLICGPVTAIVADVSFISLTKALPASLALAAPGCWLVALIKPQFEVGADGIGKGGIVRDVALRDEAVARVRNWIDGQARWHVGTVLPSPITGGSGNQEFLIGAVHDG